MNDMSERQELVKRYKIYTRMEAGLLVHPTFSFDGSYNGYISEDDAVQAIQKHADENGYAGIRDLVIVPEIKWDWKEGY